MSQFLLVLAVALTVGTVIFGVMVAIGGGQELRPVEPDGRAVPLPADRPLVESDVSELRFDLAWRGYRMDQVDEALRRAAYDIGYKEELIKVLEAEVAALREGRLPEAENLRRTREAALTPTSAAAGGASASGTPDSSDPPAAPDEPTTPPADEAAEAAPAAPGAPSSHSGPPPDAEVGDGPIAAEAGAPAQRVDQSVPEGAEAAADQR